MRQCCFAFFSSLVLFKSIKSLCTATSLSGTGGKSQLLSRSSPTPQSRCVLFCTFNRETFSCRLRLCDIYFQINFQVNDLRTRCRCKEEQSNTFMVVTGNTVIRVKPKKWSRTICDEPPKDEIKVNFIYLLFNSFLFCIMTM